MTQAADLILRDGDVRTMADETAAAVAVRDGTIVRVGSSRDVGKLEGVETETIDLAGRTLLPGFIDAHTHLDIVGQQQREADLSDAGDPDACLAALEHRRDETDEGWILGFGYDESRWDGDYLTRGQLDTVSEDRPIVAFREDLHLASVNSVVLDRFGETLPAENVFEDGGTPTGVLVEEAVATLREELKPDRERMRSYLLAAQEYAHSKGVTTVHDMVRKSHAPAVYRQLDLSGDLTLRVRLNYWADHLDAIVETGLQTNHGSDRLEMGAIKCYADGSLGGRTARLSEPYADGEGRGEWVTDPDELAAFASTVDEEDLQLAIHAIGDDAIAGVLDAYEGTSGERHRIEHVEVLTEELIERLTAAPVVVSVQPNFLKWARSDGLYDDRLGSERRRQTNQFARFDEADVALAFGSDCMPLDPLFGIEQAVTVPEPAQQLDVTAAIRAYTTGGAYAGYDEDRLGTIEVGTCADFVVLEASPWEVNSISEIDVELTIVDGTIVYDSSSAG